MSGDFFDRLEAELAGIARERKHVGAGRDSRRLILVFRRSAVIVIMAAALAASLCSEFPASANGRADARQISLVRSA